MSYFADPKPTSGDVKGICYQSFVIYFQNEVFYIMLNDISVVPLDIFSEKYFQLPLIFCTINLSDVFEGRLRRSSSGKVIKDSVNIKLLTCQKGKVSTLRINAKF